MKSLVSLLTALAILALGACTTTSGGPSPTASPAGSPGTPPASSPGSERLVVGLGYIPSVQFAQFYLADSAGYYRDEGLEVEFQNRIDPELITLLGQGAVDVGMGDGTSVIAAVANGIPVRYVATIYARFPNVVFAETSSGIDEPADLAGRRLGTPGRFGSSWIMVQALLASAGLTPDDLEVELYPDFGQRAALEAGRVDAATGFRNNEPVEMELGGTDVTMLTVDEITPLPGPGLVAGTTTLERRRDALAAFVRATLRAMEEIIADPQKGLDATLERVPELAEDPETQRAILDATIETWTSPYTEEHGLGAIDREAWTSSVEFMRSLPDTVVARPVTVEELVMEDLVGE